MSRLLHNALLLVTISHFACRTQNPEPPRPEPWREEAAFTYFYRTAVSSGVWEDQLFVLTEFTLAEVQPDGSALHRSLPLRARAPLPLTRDYIVLYQAEPSGLVFVPTKRPDAAPEDRFFVPFATLGYGDAGSIEKLSKINVAVNSNGQLLLPLQNANGLEALVLFSVQVSPDRQRVEDVTTQVLDDYPDLANVSTIQPMGTDFLVGLVSQLGYSFKVYPDGHTKKVYEEPIFKVYPASDQWYAYGLGGTYLSEDNGESWDWVSTSLLAFGLPNMSTLIGYGTVAGKRIVWDAISHYELTERTDQPGFKSRRLSKDGFSGHLILEIQEWNGRVYAVTPTGVFSRSTEDFFSEAE